MATDVYLLGPYYSIPDPDSEAQNSKACGEGQPPEPLLCVRWRCGCCIVIVELQGTEEDADTQSAACYVRWGSAGTKHDRWLHKPIIPCDYALKLCPACLCQ